MTELQGALAYLDNLAEQRRHLEQVTTDARDVAIVALRALAAASDDPHALARELVRSLYWDYPQIPVREIYAAFPNVFRGVNEVHALAGPGPAVLCPQCGELLRNRTSRTDMGHRWELCAECSTRRSERWNTERREQDVRRQSRIREAASSGLLTESIEPSYRMLLDTETGERYWPEEIARAGVDL